MTKDERRYVFILALVLIGLVLWFTVELGEVDRESDEGVIDFVFGSTRSELPAWEVAIVRMINRVAPGVLILCAILYAAAISQGSTIGRSENEREEGD